ncbi:MAG: PD-(D/E)XK nuclease-like domain-containing protein [Oligosphaeraceae bacterium]
MNTDRLLTIPADEYHAASRSGRYMSSHLLADFRESPELYRRKTNGEIAETESPALALGRAAHCLILEGRAAFDEQFLVAEGPVNPRTGEPYGKATRAYAEWLAAQTREVVSPRDFGFIVRLQRSVWTHPVAGGLLDDGVSEATVRAEYCGVPCQIRMDWLSPEHGIVDLKTCDSLKWFEGDCRRFGYVFQMAFYRAVLREATGESVHVHLIAVEKNEPFSTGVWSLTEDVLDQAEKVNGAALARYRRCLRTGEWPTGYEETRTITSL